MYTGNHNLQSNAKCPFFRCDYKRTITCEETGFCLSFKSEKQKDRHAEKYCMKECPKGCPVYDGIMRRYD